MSTIPTIEPAAVTAGDTITWKRALPDYPASGGWVLSYILLSSTNKITITGSASGDDHLISVPAATSAAYLAGTYAWQAYVTKATDRITIGSGSLIINKNFAALTTSDTRSHAKKVLEAIESVLEGTASNDQQELTINGTTLKRKSIADLLKLRQFYLNEYQNEQKAEKLAAGLGSGNRIMVRFR
jgi:hypothetical protein